VGDTGAHEPEDEPKRAYSVCSTTKVDICFVTEKNEVEEIKMVFDPLTDGL